jgi:aspartyl-tRNA(Asn)/glutamyl-tRNA(Gln) amidotransferase subunit B
MTDPTGSEFEVVIGLEVHAQLRTKSKLFSPAPVSYREKPNHSVHPVCLALPGVLPVLNKRAVELAIRAALATHCKVHPRSIFARKNYFYPDLPKGYQISQYEDPLATGGWIDIPVENGDGAASTKRIRLTRIHMEEDAGKSIHDDAVAGGDATLIDLNRAGVPLIEIVSEPDLRSAEEASTYLRTVRSLLRYTGVSDADMEKGHLRCDVNVSLRPIGSDEFGTRAELKNLNSFRFIEEAIAAEIERQTGILRGGGQVKQATMNYDPQTHRTRVLRMKEDADDYRYFPDPDLIPMLIPTEEIERIRSEVPELADQKCERFQTEHGLSEYDATQLTVTRSLADFFEAAARAHGEPKSVANWILRDVMQALNERDLSIDDSALSPEGLAGLMRLVDDGKTTAKSARGLVPELIEAGGDPAALVRERGLDAMSDSGLIGKMVSEVLTEHPDSAELFRTNETKVMNFLMGQVMRKTQGKADPAAVREILTRELRK